MPRRLLILTMLAVSALAGCETGVTIYEPIYRQRYSSGELEYATQHGELRTTVIGNPFATSREEFSDSVMRLMKGANRGPVFTYTAAPTRIEPGTNESKQHVVVAFGARINVPAADLCKRPDAVPVERTGGDVRMMAAFCFEEQLSSEAAGTARDVRGLDDPKFVALVRGVTFALFPETDRKRQMTGFCLIFGCGGR